MDFALTLVAALWLAAAAPLLLRVRSEYARDGVLGQVTVGMVWLYYGVLLALIIATAVAETWDLGLPSAASLWLGLPLVAIGAAIDIAGVISMGSLARMNGTCPDQLVTSGAFRYSRNPQNVGIGIAAFGVGLLGDSGLALALAVAVIAVFRVYLVFEEAHLERTFGAEYTDYERRVPRFLGIPGR